jgi:xanthine dehydrogenase YagT iron-sulfur-binding subunit
MSDSETNDRVVCGPSESLGPSGGESEDKDGLLEDEEAIFAELERDGTSRREFLALVSAAGFGIFAIQLAAEREALAAGSSLGQAAARGAGAADLNPITVKLQINGRPHTLTLDSRVSLLDALRERLAFTGTKKGCDQGQCGACTVVVDGRRVLSCLTLAAQAEGRSVTTVEGLASGDRLHPVQAAFIKYDAFQCGYCTPGQICSAVALLEEAKRGDASHVTADVAAASTSLSDDEIRERMSGNLCRCGAYPKIVAAIQEVHSGRETARTWRFVDGEELARVRREEAGDETV